MSSFKIINGSCADQEVDAVVNAANVEANKDAVQEAAGACPVSAIIVE